MEDAQGPTCQLAAAASSYNAIHEPRFDKREDGV